jgi:heparanase 1
MASMRAACFLGFLVAGCHGCAPDTRQHLTIATDHAVAQVSDRFLSIAIDTAQVVGGNFWTPGQTDSGGTGPVPAFDFTRARLAALTRPLGHAYLRIGGTDADRTFYALGAAPSPTPPPNYQWTLTRAEVDALSTFARADDLQVLFTLNAGAGPRTNGGPWQPDNARELIRYATAQEIPVAAWELGNEVNAYAVVLGFSLAASDYAADVRTARALLAAEAPTAKLVAPASAYWPIIGELGGLLPAFAKIGGNTVDALTWHYYPQQSARCPVAVRSATPTRLLDPDNLDEIDRWADDVLSAQKSAPSPSPEIWLDETSNAQCGGAPGISDRFVSSLWWLDELGKMARRGTPVVIRQSLTGADYGLISEPSLDPRPDYFASVLWRKLMGARALAASTKSLPNLRLYAQCASADFPAGAVTVLAINLDATATPELAFDNLGGEPSAYLVTADDLQASTARLNGQPLLVGDDGSLPPLTAAKLRPTLPAHSYAFVVFPQANAGACR